MNDTSEFDYKKYLNLIVKKKYLFVVLALVIMTGVVITSYLLPKRYEARCTVFIEKSILGDLVKGIAVMPAIEDRLRVLAYAIKSRTLLLKVFDDLDLNITKQNDGQLEETVREFQKKTDIKMKDQEGMFVISFTHDDPRIARDYVNTLVRRYIEENISSKREESYGATKFLGEQIATLEKKLEKSEAQANIYRRDNGGVLAQTEGELLRGISEAQQQIAEISQKNRQLINQQSLLKKNDPLQVKLTSLQRREQELGLVYTDIHPEIVDIKNQIAFIKEQSRSTRTTAEVPTVEQEAIRMELNSQRVSEMNLRRLISSKYAMLRSIPAVKTGLEELERERSVQKSMYEQLVTRYGQAEVSKQIEVQDKSTTFRIVDPAVIPVKPVSPQRIKMILLGILGGFAGSFAFIVLLDQLDKSVRSADVLKSLGVQILAVVPKIENPLNLIMVRKRDYLFFTLAGAYFLLILAAIPFELLQAFSLDIFNPVNLKQNLSNLKNISFK